jgi:hypothetical protein
MTAAASPGPADGPEPALDRFVRFFAEAAPDPLVVELRALGVPQLRGRPLTECAFFDLASAPGRAGFAAAIRAVNGRGTAQQPGGVYLTMNPLAPELLGRADGRWTVCAAKGLAATDADVRSRRWIVIDVDPVRPSGTSATQEEKAHAERVADGVRDDLAGRKWPVPALVDSGNGYHLWYAVNLPADDGGRVARLLRALAKRHDTAGARIDTTMSNPARIVKVPGTWARKGPHSDERPHRLARVLELPRDQ